MQVRETLCKVQGIQVEASTATAINLGRAIYNLEKENDTATEGCAKNYSKEYGPDFCHLGLVWSMERRLMLLRLG